MKFTKSFILVFILLGFLNLNAQNNLYFPPIGDQWAAIDPSTLGWDITKLDDLKSFLETTHTKSFIVLKDGKIALEYYLNDHDVTKPWYWASAGKSLTSVICAFAEAEGKLNLELPSSNYLGKGWSSCTSTQEDAILVRHHLTMTTGLDEAVSFDCTDKDCLKYKVAPGTRWSYHNAPYTIIDEIIMEATGQNLNAYFKKNIGDKIGMTGLYAKSGYNNVFYSTARSMARFGLLVLAKGKWNDVDILNNQLYVEKMSKSSQDINPSYGYLWWLNGKDKFMLPSSQIVFPKSLIPAAPPTMFSALGKNDQKVHIVPDQNIVVIRMGDDAYNSGSNVPIQFDIALWEKLNVIMKLNTAANENTRTISKKKIAYYFGQKIRINGDVDIEESQVFDTMGKQVITSKNEHEINASQLTPGIYFVSIKDKNGDTYMNKVMVR